MRGLEGHHPAPSIQAVLDCATSLTRDGFPPSAMGGFDAPGARALSRTTRNQPKPRQGWQKRGNGNQFDTRFPPTRLCAPQLTDTEAALLRFTGGPHGISSIDSHPFPGRNSGWNRSLFRLLFLRRPQASHCLCLPVPAGVAVPLDVPWPPPCSVRGQQGCWGVEAGSWRTWQHACAERPEGRVRVNVFRPGHGPSRFSTCWTARRLEVVVDGLPLWNGAQLAIDTTMVSPVRRDGTAQAGTANNKTGRLLDVARSQKARRYPELSGEKRQGPSGCHGHRSWRQVVS